MRVLFLFGDPHDDILYLPEYGAYKRMVTRYSGKGPFLNAPKPEPPNQAGDKIWNILFFENGSTCFVTKLGSCGKKR